MAQQVGDLWPFSSGTSSLGAEMTNGGFTGAMRPFGHVHMNSGVFHDPTVGNSGIIRFQTAKEGFSPSHRAFGLSLDGGKNFILELTDGASPLDGEIAAPFGAIRLIGSGSIVNVALNGAVLMTAAGGGGGLGDVVGLATQQINLSPFNASGQLEFRFGPHQAWYEKLTHSNTGGPFNDGFWPIPHSGQIAQMIRQGVSLQDAYNNGHTISTSLAAHGPVAITGTDQSALRIAVNEGQGIHLELSGVIAAPTLFTYQGGLFMARHSHNLSDPFLSSATEATLKASSPGLPTLWLHTGTSGIIAVRTGSGICQFFNNAQSASISELGLNINIPATAQTNTDTFYRGVAQSGIKFFVDGLYRMAYVISVTKDAGELMQQANSEFRINDQWGRTFRILGSQSYAQIRDGSPNNTNTGHGHTILDMNAGEILNVNIAANAVPVAPNSMIVNARACTIHLEYLGPQRGSSAVRQEIVP